MGFTPQDVRAMSMWQYFAALDGFQKANGAEEGMTKAEEDDLWDWINE
ncbi:hypothetical protein [Neorhizobium alkalisoli]|nr:hypothetical protein [Neorhizobium alkalisoli]